VLRVNQTQSTIHADKVRIYLDQNSINGMTTAVSMHTWSCYYYYYYYESKDYSDALHYTISVDVAADRRRRRTWTSADFWSVSARYCGAVPLRQRYVKAHNQNWIRSGTRNQCSWRRSGVMCSDFPTENTNRAAAFRTDCNLCSSATGRPAVLRIRGILLYALYKFTT